MSDTNGVDPPVASTAPSITAQRHLPAYRCFSSIIWWLVLIYANYDATNVHSVPKSTYQALDEDIPRSYVKALYDRIHELNSQIALLPRQGKQDDSTIIIPNPNAAPSPRFVHMPGPREDAYLDLCFPSRATKTVFEVLAQVKKQRDSTSQEGQKSPDIPRIEAAIDSTQESAPAPSDLALVDRALLTPSAARILLARYSRCIKPQYDILPPHILGHDGLGLKKLQRMDQFCILMACAIAAARQSYRTPSWRVYAHVCRDWANDLVTPIISAADGDSLMATVLLLVYELADPSRGLVWELLDVAVRTCVQLGWHRSSTSNANGTVSEQSPGGREDNTMCGPEGRRLLQSLHRINQSLQVIYNRPDLSRIDLAVAEAAPTSSATSMSDTSPSSYSLQAYIALHDTLEQNQGCPFAGDVAACMDQIPLPLSGASTATYPADLPLINDAWLLFLPVIAHHRQCVNCFQEADDANSHGMLSLRRHVLDAAVAQAASVYRDALAGDGFIPPVVASTRAFVAGCALATAIAKRWTFSPVPSVSASTYMHDIVRCTEVLALFAPHWEGGHNYLHVWRTIVDGIGDAKIWP